MTETAVSDLNLMSSQSEEWLTLAQFFAEDKHDNIPATDYQVRRTFEGVTFEGKRVLDIGSGRGLMSLYAGASGAAHVTSMEPELDGSRSGVVDTLRSRCEAMNLTNIHPVTADFNTWEIDPEPYDILMSFASINHIRESPHNAATHRPTWDAYSEVIAKFAACLRPGGTAIVTDASRYGFFFVARDFGIRRPWTRRRTNINWRVHQQPGTWKRLFLANGFSKVEIRYPVPFRFRSLSPLFDNGVASFFTKASFILKATK